MVRQGRLRDPALVTFTTVAGLDLSLTGAGVGVLVLNGDGHSGYTQTHGYELKRPTLRDQLARIDVVRDAVLRSIDEIPFTPSLITIEEMPYGASGRSTLDRATLWNDVVRGIIHRGIRFAPVNVSSLKIYATGKGSGIDKDAVMLAIARRYPEIEIENNNEADAFGLAAMAARFDGCPIETSLPQTHLRAMEKVKLA